MNKKYVLGTAQLSAQNYGITNDAEKISKKKIYEILTFAWNKNIRYFDTAPGYNNEKIIGEFIKNKKIENKIKIISKISFIKNEDIYKTSIRSIYNSLKLLNINKIHTLFIHNQKDFYRIKKKKDFFKDLSRVFNIKNFGFSVYDKVIAEKILEYFPSSCLQFPFNLANDSFLKVKKRKGLFFARSIFLQGLLISKKIKKNNTSLYDKHKNYLQLIKNEKFNPLNSCIDFVNNNNNIDYIIFGVKNIDQLKNILGYKPNMFLNLNTQIKIKKIFNNKYSDPRIW